MPKTVFRILVGGRDVDLVPPVPSRAGYFSTVEWFAEQGLGDPSYVERIDVVEDDAGSLTAYVFRCVTEDRPGPKIVLNEWGFAEKVWEHHPVTSVKLLLDQLAMAPAE